MVKTSSTNATSIFQLLKQINYKWHIFTGLLVRIALIIYSTYHDEVAEVAYTDVDYKVFTDASRHIWQNNSPYERHTYRYTPLIALILLPNIFLHNSFGKLLFSLIDLLVGILIRLLVKNSLKEYEAYKHKLELKSLKADESNNKNNLNSSGKTNVNINNKINYNKTNANSKKNQNNKNQQSKNATSETVTSYIALNPEKMNAKRRLRKKSKNFVEKISLTKKTEKIIKTPADLAADSAMILWLYNPLTIVIATRGNCDSIAGCLVLITLYFLQCKKKSFTAGLMHGLSVHLRLYPIAYSLAFFMYLSKYSYYTDNRRKSDYYSSKVKNKLQDNKLQVNNTTEIEPFNANQERKTIFKKEYLLYLLPNFEQIKLITGCLFSLSVLTGLFYQLYGYKFLHETYIYHLFRKDPRHNFSLYFYLQYLTAGIKNIGIWQTVLIMLPQIVLLLVFSVRYGLNKLTLNFSVLTLTIVMITYNTVLTSQYFIWMMSILPLCLWQIKVSKKTAFFLVVIWFAAQAAWLLPAYFLEFHGQNTFLFIWIQSVSFFCANVAILGRLIMNFMPIDLKISKSS